MNDLSYDDIIKISIIGDAGNGKTSLIRRFSQNNFTNENKELIGNKNIKKIKIKIWVSNRRPKTL